MPQVIESFFQLPPSPFDSDFNSSLDSVCTTPTQSSDTSSDVSVDTYDPSALKVDQATQDQTCFSAEEGGSWRLNIPDLKTKDEVKHFLEIALPQLDKKVREVKCSLCERKKVDKLWKVRPANLERHILGHLGIKNFECSTCGALFMTKDQERKHTEKKHIGLQEVDAHGGTSHKPAEEGVPCDMYPELPPTTAPFLGGIEPWMTYRSYQVLQTEYNVPGGEYCDLMNGYP
ncbi:hypothetical protein RSOLAG1IB_04361 [Rhizoctonia solani AG-1 IB]|uniref:C2H2-type domain-containing protein n=1 Tax=Thanatephorus cucumeris (strain AG1-IB / isolate 7/3/14) TaxID=1108050 RepID=M5C926_THACB|nr:hypothetical protein BN14_06391 [Rhizoctonia solani AG-1 IB]CEL61611.1 hypothetical protein RSOLAG1IB_04361 [Rhizoctonia solani AG-1 IB]